MRAFLRNTPLDASLLLRYPVSIRPEQLNAVVSTDPPSMTR